MKNLFKNLMLVAVAAMAFTACQKDNEDVNRVNETTVVEFKAEFDTTRSGFNEKDGEGYSSHWDGGEAINLEVVSTAGVASPLVAPTMEADGTFKAELNGSISNEGTITALIPAASWKSEYNYDTSSYEMVPSIPGTQTPEAGSVDAAAHILKAEKAFESGLGGVQTLAFAHQVAYAKMTLNTTVAIDEIAQVVVEIDDQRYTLLPENLTEPTFWFACKEATPEAMTVTITDVNDTTYAKVLDLANAVKPLAFTTGRVASFTVGGFEEVVVEYVKSISAYYTGSRYQFTIDTNDGGRLWPYVYAAPDANGLLAVGEYDSDESGQSSFGYMYADIINYNGYEDFDYYYVTVAQLAEGYEISFYLTGNKGAELEFTYTGVVSGICNPPVPEAVEVTAEATEISGNGNQYFTLNLTAGNYRFSNVWFDSGVAGQIIPAGDFNTMDTTIAYLDAEGNETGWAFAAEGTLNVAHDVENQEYVLTFTFTDAIDSTFTVTYTGKIDGIFSPGEATPLSSPQGLQAVVSNYTTVTFSWDAVDGAGSYEVYHEYWDNNTYSSVASEHQTVTSTSVVFEGLEMATYYNFYVKALPANEAINTPSEWFAQTGTETGFDISLFEAEVNVNYDSYTKVDSTYTFSNAESNTLKIPFNPALLNLEAGSYVNNYGWPEYYGLLNADFNNIYVDGSNYFANVLALEVAIDGNTYTISIAGTLYYTADGSQKTFKGVFEGEIATAEKETITLVSATATDRLYNGEGEVLVTFDLEDSTNVSLAFKTGTTSEHDGDYTYYAKMYINPGEWGAWESGLTEGYVTNSWVNGSVTSNYSVVTVGYENEEYSFEFEINNKLYTYTGAVTNLTAPEM